ncbi:MAG: NAD(P)-dependent alcohol dehydrogenase [Alphaproteobacteria bacterium]|nr:NAD(P)-dependent alcohol dehydrogenase [Alphaproteobacteria bacterium]MBV9421074.1 NAD(P)-dependent alcohol dehydrogenase [Alphaproteobacteria bacterium]
MKAAICLRYGPPEVLEVRDVPDPVPGVNDVLIRIHGAAITPSDCFIRSGIPTARLVSRLALRIGFGFAGPRRPILGAVIAGEIEATGRRVKRFRAGDHIWAFSLMRMGGYAQRMVLPERFKLLTHAPSNFSHEEAAAVPYGGLIASHFLNKGAIKSGQRVLIYGASGANGTIGVQLAKHRGAHVTAVCSAANRDLVHTLGADAVLDYMRDPPSALGRYDVIFDAVGRRKTSPLKAALPGALNPGGVSISVDDGLPRARRENLLALKALAEAGALRPVIDRAYPLADVAEAHRYVERGHKRGNVLLAP